MSTRRPTRRRFLRTAATSGALLGIGNPSEFLHLAVARGETPHGRPWHLRYDPAIEPTVRLIEDTPAEQCVEVLAAELRRGLTYRQFMTALFLAGLRNGGDLGYYHCIYMIHSANHLSLDAPVDERLLAMFGAVSQFKYWQQRRAGGPDHFGMQAFPATLPDADKARSQFHAAMRQGDPDAAEAAIIVLARSEGVHQLFELMAPYAYRGGGVHWWIFLSNSWRVLESIGWHHAEPVLRSMARQFSYDSSGDEESFEHWYRTARARTRTDRGVLPAGWASPTGDPGITRDLLASMRLRQRDESFGLVMEALHRGKAHAGAVWDAVHLAAGETMVRWHENNATHTNTGVNALHYGFRISGDPETRLLILMRAVGWLCHPMSAYPTRKQDAVRITDLEAGSVPASAQAAVDEILFASDLDEARAKAVALGQRESAAQELWEARRRLVFRKAEDVHDYKYLAAVWEDAGLVSPAWRPYLVAASFRDHARLPDSPVLLQAREALHGFRGTRR
jgi:hypothetical protein